MSEPNLYCPHCSSRLLIFMRVSQSEVVAQCPNAKCDLHAIEGVGETTTEAIDRFHGTALRVECKTAKATKKGAGSK